MFEFSKKDLKILEEVLLNSFEGDSLIKSATDFINDKFGKSKKLVVRIAPESKEFIEFAPDVTGVIVLLSTSTATGKNKAKHNDAEKKIEKDGYFTKTYNNAGAGISKNIRVHLLSELEKQAKSDNVSLSTFKAINKAKNERMIQLSLLYKDTKKKKEVKENKNTSESK